MLRLKRFRYGALLVATIIAGDGLAASAHADSVPAARKHEPIGNRATVSKRVDALLAQMTQAEKMRLVYGYFGSGANEHYQPPQAARPSSAGYIPGIARLGIPPQWETDAGLGVASQRDIKIYSGHTALPSGLATAATWNPELAYRGGSMIGSEARASGFNVMLAGGVNLARDPRNGRNFEYAGEDPLLAGTIVGAEIAGIQSNHIIATVKHYALNDQEFGRTVLSSEIDHKAAHLSDLLSFELAIDHGHPGAVMCAYNRINSVYACENDWLLNDVLKGEWHYPGYVMSDWGAVHSTVQAANAGLDQESAAQSFDKEPYFGAPLAAAINAGKVPASRLDDMVRRILTAMVDHALFAYPVKPKPIDLEQNAKISLADAEESLVLMKNDGGVLPIANAPQKIVVIGSHADVGVLSGGGSSQVYPKGGPAIAGLGPSDFPGPMVYYPSSPLAALKKQLPKAHFTFATGDNVAEAAQLAAQSDIAIIFVHQWAAESVDAPFQLPDHQDELVAAVAARNGKSIIILETGGPVAMPWLKQVPAIVAAWYPGTSGGTAIADMLSGATNPSGHLPISFPADERQLPRPVMNGDPQHDGQPFNVNYSEGAAVGYKWFDQQKLQPLFAFGHGLSYTQFVTSGLKARVNGTHVIVTFKIKNVGPRAGAAVPQLYAGPIAGGWEAPRRLVGWRKLVLAPGKFAQVTINVEPKILADYDAGWVINKGRYTIGLGTSERDITQSVEIKLPAQRLTSWPK